MRLYQLLIVLLYGTTFYTECQIDSWIGKGIILGADFRTVLWNSVLSGHILVELFGCHSGTHWDIHNGRGIWHIVMVTDIKKHALER
jgi:hypothetical protein